MPVIIAIAIRYVIMAAVQLGLWSLLENFGMPLLNGAIKAIMKFFGVSEETATDIMANKILLAFESVGIFAVTLRTKLPIKFAERLGFTSKGYAKRKITTAAGVKAETEVAKIAVAKTGGTVITATEAAAAVEVAKTSLFGFKPAYLLISSLVSTIFMGFMVIGNWIDFGNWNNGAYQKSMQKFITWISFGALVPDVDYRKSLTLSNDTFSKIYNTFKLGGAAGIQDPFKGVEVPFTRENLLDLTDKVGSTLLMTDGTASTKKVLAAVLPMIIFVLGADVDKAIASSAVASAVASSAGTTTPSVKVFTGIVSQGVVGAGLTFTARPDDMIDSVTELRDAAANNLAPFLASLPSKVIYEVKVVSSITTKDGFKQTGTTQKIQIGTFANGTPKYKTVTNKFATLILYVLTDRGTRTKLTTVVLGPVDSAKLTVAQNDLRELELALPKMVTTSDIKEITTIQTTEQVNITIPKVQGSIPATLKGLQDFYIASGLQQFTLYNDNILRVPGYEDKTNPNATSRLGLVINNPDLSQLDMTRISKGGPVNWNDNSGISHTVADEAWQRAEQLGTIENLAYTINTEIARNTTTERVAETSANLSASATAPVVSQSAVNVVKDKASATTLFEWYQAQGKSLPSVSVRAQLYADMGLGNASYYTGTTEQNTKLLAALKTGTNVQVSDEAWNKEHIVNNMYLQV